mmetsp:Transcript_24820/g.49580  ORF Transcript_24820/g.49580 Transcript_24820/m.49580 type:complete len:209 (-) Transcript_24820:126-752(-)
MQVAWKRCFPGHGTEQTRSPSFRSSRQTMHSIKPSEPKLVSVWHRSKHCSRRSSSEERVCRWLRRRACMWNRLDNSVGISGATAPVKCEYTPSAAHVGSLEATMFRTNATQNISLDRLSVNSTVLPGSPKTNAESSDKEAPSAAKLSTASNTSPARIIPLAYAADPLTSWFTRTLPSSHALNASPTPARRCLVVVGASAWSIAFSTFW